MNTTWLLTGLIALVAAPVLGGLLAGFDRILTARMQGRVGPPLFQPFYDVFKLFEKRGVSVSHFQNFYIVCFVLFTAFATGLFFAGQDLLLVVFALTAGGVFLVLGAFSPNSPYSTIGAERELLQMLAYEPMLLIAVMGLYLVAGTAIGPTPAAPAVLDTGKATTILACPPGDTNLLSASNQAASVSSAPVPASNTVASNTTVAAGCGATPCCQEAGLPACGTPASKTRAQADRNFKVATILHNARQGGMGWRMLLNLGGIFLGFLFILTIKLRKSPFDLSTSHHGHQEVVKGLTTEFSGKTLAWIEIGHWYENILLMGFVWLFFSGLHPAVAAALVAAVYFLEILVDNASARLKWQTMVKAAWIVTLVLGVSNLLFLFYFNR